VRTFGHRRPIRNKQGEIISHQESPVRAVTTEELGGAFGLDKKRRLVVTLIKKDMIEFRPQGTTSKRAVSLRAVDVYRYALMCRANLAQLEKARAAKERKAERLASARLASAERRMRDQARKECAAA
jgi:hypothetical protein